MELIETRQARDRGSSAHSNVENIYFSIISSSEYIESELFSLNFMFSVAMPLIALVNGLNHVSLCISE